jgi:hypothetical protein
MPYLECAAFTSVSQFTYSISSDLTEEQREQDASLLAVIKRNLRLDMLCGRGRDVVRFSLSLKGWASVVVRKRTHFPRIQL